MFLLWLLLLWMLLHLLLLSCCCADLQTVSRVSRINAGGSQVNNPLAFQVDAHLRQDQVFYSFRRNRTPAIYESGAQPVPRAPPLCWIAPEKVPAQVPALLPQYHAPSPGSRKEECIEDGHVNMLGVVSTTNAIFKHITLILFHCHIFNVTCQWICKL